MYNFKETEKNVTEFWQKKETYKKVKEKNKGKKPFYYLDGPPYTSGKVHLGTAYGKILRDAVMRYKRMQGLDVWDRAGFDMHGLPTEHAVEKKIGIKEKEEIKKFGIQNYINECKKLSIENMQDMIQDFKKLGVWMDFENPYMPITTEYIEGVWWLIKRAHDTGRLYEGKRTMHWCASCQTANAKHEIEYTTLTDKSVYLKFPVVGEQNTFLIIWTTTPWTIPFNLAVMAGPEIDYIKARVREEIWILAKERADKVIVEIVETGYTIEQELKGKDLEGLKYRHPLEEKIPQVQEMQNKYEKLHTVVLSEEYVTIDTGSGLVHCAPGCGQEDYEVGHFNHLPPFNELNEQGRYTSTIPAFEGLKAKQDDEVFIQALQNSGYLIATQAVTHEYPICWRCKTPVVFRTTNQWFFKVEDLKENMKDLNKKVTWIPEWAGSQQFHNWLDNLRDNSITKQRYWGTPLPIWKNEESQDYIVIGSLKELQQYTKDIPPDLHKPAIDNVIIQKNGKIYKKIPDVIDVWVDAGCASWLCLDYPKKSELITKLFPPDFILEGKDQIRGWFNILLVASMIGMEKHSYKAVYMHGFINDSQGRKMSKSLQNYILPQEVTDQFGSDTFRYYFMGAANPGIDVNYNFNDITAKHRNLDILINLKNYLLQIAQNCDYKGEVPQSLDIEEMYMISLTNTTIAQVTQLYETYHLNEIPQQIEDLFLELSRFYLQVTREKANSTEEEKQKVAFTMSYVMANLLKIAAPMMPYVTESIYQQLKEKFHFKQESVHLTDWPKAEKGKIEQNLEQQIQTAKVVLQAILGQRDKAQLGIRWPLKKATVYVQSMQAQEAIKVTKRMLEVQANIKELYIEVAKKDMQSKLEGQSEIADVLLDTELTEELEREGYAREVTRLLQALRKKASLQKQDRIIANIESEYNLTPKILEIGQRIGAIAVNWGKPTQVFTHTDTKTIKGKEFSIALKKI